MTTSSGPERAKSVHSFREMKRRGEPITVLTAYDHLLAGYLERAGVDMILVGDSLGMTVLGYASTVPVTLDDMIHHGSAVRRGAPRSFVVLDLPFMSYQVSAEQALLSAGRAMKESEVNALKLEGGGPAIAETVRRMTSAGVPVMGHLGLTPQSVHQLGGYRVQGRAPSDAERMEADALELEAAGCFAVVLELVPSELAARISERLDIPTIGIGAGPGCDGQVLVTYDALGMNPGFEPRFLRRFAEAGREIERGLQAFVESVRDGTFPTDEHGFSADP